MGRFVLAFCALALGAVSGIGCSDSGGSPEGAGACTEQGIRDAVAEGGVQVLSCDGPTTVVTQAEILIDRDLVLDGGGDLRVNADFGHRAFVVAQGVAAELRGLEVTRAIDGGITNLGTLMLTGSSVTDNRGWGIRNGDGDPGSSRTDLAGTLTVMNSTVAGNLGGGILSFGTLTVTNSTVSENLGVESGGGEGIMFGGDLTVASSTFSGNAAAAVSNIGGGETAAVTKSLIDGECYLAGNGEDSGGYNIESPGDSCPFGHETDQVDVPAKALKLGPLRDHGGPTMTHALLPGSVALDQISGAMCELDTDQRGVTRPQGKGCDIGAFELEASDEPAACSEGGFGNPGLPCPCTAICNFEERVCEEGSNGPRGERCAGGICDGEGNCVECYADEQCGDDFNECTEHRCDGAYGECITITLPNGAPCEGGECQAGQCALSSSVLPCTEQGIRNALAAGGGPYTFSCDGPTVVTTSADLEIDKDVILDGEGNLTVDGDGTRAVFSIGQCVFNGLPVGGGAACGASGEAEIHGITVTGGVFGFELQNEEVEIMMSRCTVSGNSEVGVSNDGVLTLAASTVSRNAGRGIDNTGTLTLLNSTVSGNSDAGIQNLGEATLRSCTLSGDGVDAISNEGTATLIGTLVDGRCSGTRVESEGYNIQSPGESCELDQEGDLDNVMGTELNLGPLDNNGGPTETRELEAGSVAIDRIPAAMCPAGEDQRGEPRPAGPMCDVGAFEVQPAP